MKVDFIAEVSSNHSANLDRCIEFIDKSSDIGCDAVKFQLFKINKLFSKEILKSSKEIADRKNWELPIEFLEPIAKHCNKRSIRFACTPFYLEAVDELLPYVSFFKIASYELLWDDLLAACANTGKDIVISTGMATIDEIQHAVKVLKENGCDKPLLLHCVSNYPSSYAEVNLSSIQTIRDLTDCEVGWSDHSVDPAVMYRAIHKWGARAVEFHLDLDGNGEEYTSGHCWLPDQIGTIIKDINHGFIADGDGRKRPTLSEEKERLWRTDPSDGLRPMKLVRDNYKS